jgi:hypothetical protein
MALKIGSAQGYGVLIRKQQAELKREEAAQSKGY